MYRLSLPEIFVLQLPECPSFYLALTGEPKVIDCLVNRECMVDGAGKFLSLQLYVHAGEGNFLWQCNGETW